MKKRTVKGFAVEMKSKNGKWSVVNEGWGWHSRWIFRHKWNAEDAIQDHLFQEWKDNQVRIVPCTITY